MHIVVLKVLLKQITQMHYPIGANGYVMINVDGEDRKILIHDINNQKQNIK